MATTLSAGNYSTITQASNYAKVSDAPQQVFDAGLAERLAPVAVASGFIANKGAFLEAVKLRPLTTLIDWVAYMGKP